VENFADYIECAGAHFECPCAANAYPSSDLLMKLRTLFRLIALAISSSPLAVNAQIDDFGYGVRGNVSEFMSRDIQFSPTWQSYQSYAQPTAVSMQRPAAPRAPAPLSNTATIDASPLPKQTDYALRFFGGDSARQTLQQLPQRVPSGASGPLSMTPRGQKPFRNMSHGHTISPWLNLDRPETSEELPNYFTFVRPQFEQNNVNHRQQRDLNNLQRQVQTASYNAPVTARGGIPSTGHGSRFGDTGRYYGGWRR
jgi:hypothetical protein